MEILLFFFNFVDSLLGRKIMRAIWDYYKVDGVITTEYELQRKITPTGSEREGPGEAGFSMLKLKEIAKQRELFSSIESFTSGDDDTDEDDDDDDEDDDYFSDGSSYSYKTDEDIEENGSSSYSSVWRKRRKERR